MNLSERPVAPDRTDLKDGTECLKGPERTYHTDIVVIYFIVFSPTRFRNSKIRFAKFRLYTNASKFTTYTTASYYDIDMNNPYLCPQYIAPHILFSPDLCTTVCIANDPTLFSLPRCPRYKGFDQNKNT